MFGKSDQAKLLGLPQAVSIQVNAGRSSGHGETDSVKQVPAILIGH